MYILFKLFLVCFFLFHTSLFGNSIQIDESTSDINILNKSLIYIDKNSKQEITHMVSSPNLFTSIKKDHLNFGYILKDTVWLKFTIENSSIKSIKKNLVYTNINTNIINLYTKKNDKLTIIKSGVHNRRKFDGQLFFSFDIKLDSYERKTYYLKLQSPTHSLYFKLLIQDEKRLNRSEMNNQLIQALFFGGMLVVFIYNFILYLFSRNSIYLYYVTMVFILTIHHLSLRGMMAYLLPNNPEIIIFQTSLPVYYTSLAIIAVTTFSRKFLNTYKYKKIDLILKFYIIILVLVMFFNNSENYLLELASHMTIVMSLTLEAIGIYLLVTRQETYAKYFVAVWTIVLSGFILTALYHTGIIDLPISHIFELTLMTEALLFSIILAKQINDLKNEKLKLSVELLEKENSEHKKDKIIQEQNKLASMGQMLGEIAHQWRQPLSEINSVVLDLEIDFNQKKLTQKSLNDNLEQIEAVTEHMSQTIEDFNSFYKEKQEKEDIELTQIVKKALSLLESTIRSNSISIDTNFLDNSSLKINSSKIIQALIAIITNAKDALVENDIKEKKIIITVQKKEKQNIISIEDNGPGIKEENLSKIFEPYFTTKFKSHGIGIGLYMAKRIIEDDENGQLRVENTKNGARFTILL